MDPLTGIDGMLGYLTDIAVKATVLLALAVLLTWLLRRRAAAERHMVWALAAACAVALPLAALAFPQWRLAVPLPAVVTERLAVEPSAPRPSSTTTPDEVVGFAPLSSATSAASVSPAPVMPSGSVGEPAAAPRVRTMSAAAVALWVWLAGALLVGTHLLIGLVRVQRLARRASPLRNRELDARAQRLALDMGLRRPFTLLEGDDAAMPMTFGLLRATLLLPSSARTWPAARQESVLRHELAHIRRRDSLSQFVAAIGCALYWFNPLMWLAQHRMCVEREHACDDAVLAAGARPSDYASDLLDIARTSRVERVTSLAAIAMARRSHLRTRLSALLEQRSRRASVPTSLLAPAWLCAFAVVLPMSSVRPSLAEWDVPAADSDAPALDAVVQPQPGELALASTLASEPAQDDCLSGRNTNTSINANNERRTTKWSGRGCEGEVVIEGTVQFDADFRRITGISRGGFVRLETEEAGIERRLEIEPGANGLTYDYRVNGRDAAFDEAGRAWLDATMLYMFRRMGFLAEERATAILQRQGLPALVAEIDHLHGDYAQAEYYTVAVETGRLDAATLERLLARAARTIDSDHYMTEIITAMAGRYTFTPAVRNAYITAASAIDSDHYMHNAFATLLEKGDLDSDQVAMVLRESTAISSDHYRATLLQNIAGRYRMDPAIRSAYIDAAANISSDHYQRLVFEHLMEQDGLTTADVARVVQASMRISSDHHRAELLGRVARMDLNDPTLQRAFVEATAAIGSDHYVRTVLTQIVQREQVSPAAMSAVLEAAATIGSDHHLAELLVDIANRHPPQGEMRERFMQLMDGIGSEHHRGRVASALLRRG